MFNIIIAGCRDFDDYDLLSTSCDRVIREGVPDSDIRIISGGARGADLLGERYATAKGYKILKMPADWDTHGKKAGPIRNASMAKEGDLLIAFWDGKSRGTKSMIECADREDIPCAVVGTNLSDFHIGFLLKANTRNGEDGVFYSKGIHYVRCGEFKLTDDTHN